MTAYFASEYLTKVSKKQLPIMEQFTKSLFGVPISHCDGYSFLQKSKIRSLVFGVLGFFDTNFEYLHISKKKKSLSHHA